MKKQCHQLLNITTPLALLVSLVTSTTAFAAPCTSINDFIQVDGCEFTGVIPYENGVSSVSVRAYPSTESDSGGLSLNRPIIIISPYDPENSNSFDVIYDMVDQQKLPNMGRILGSLRATDHDIVILNYGAASRGYIQQNAFAMIEALQKIEQFRATRTVGEPMVVLGMSVGGLVARYALAYMETNNIAHNVATFISYDTPHQGANIPVGLQRFTPFLGRGVGSAIAELNTFQNDLLLLDLLSLGVLEAVTIDQLLGNKIDPQRETLRTTVAQLGYATQVSIESIAAKQLLINHYNPDDSDWNDRVSRACNSNSDIVRPITYITVCASPTPEQVTLFSQQNDFSEGYHWLRAKLIDELNGMGNYPVQPRMVAFTDGATDGSRQTEPTLDPASNSIIETDVPQNLQYVNYRGVYNVPNFVVDMEITMAIESTEPAKLIFSGNMKGPDGSFAGILKRDSKTYSNDTYYSRLRHRPIDAAAGAFNPILEDTANRYNLAMEQNFGPLTSRARSSTFVPTFSSLDISVDDPNTNLQELANTAGKTLSDITPFDEVYTPTENQLHMSIDLVQAMQLFEEIRDTYNLTIAPQPDPTPAETPAPPVTVGTDIVMQNIHNPIQASVGGVMDVAGTYLNSGDTATNGLVYINLYLSKDEVYDIQDTLIPDSVMVKTGLLAGEVASYNKLVTIPSNLQAGNYYLLAVADQYQKVLESDDPDNLNGNNLAIGGLITISMNVDVQTDYVSVPPTIVAGQTFSLETSVSNIGEGRTQSNVNVVLLLSADQNYDASDIQIGNAFYVGFLGTSQTVITSKSLPLQPPGAATIAPGTYYLLAISDFLTHIVTEIDDPDNRNGNNKAVSGPIIVTAP